MLFEQSAAHAQGCNLADLFGDREALAVEFDWLLQRARAIGYIQGHETTLSTIKGRAITVELTATRLTDDNEQVGGCRSSCGMSPSVSTATKKYAT